MIQINSKKLTKFLKRFDDPLEYVITDKFVKMYVVYFLIFSAVNVASSFLYDVWYSDSLMMVMTCIALLFCSSMLFSMIHYRISGVNIRVLLAKSEGKSDLEIYEFLMSNQRYKDLTRTETKVLNVILDKYPELAL